jgi:hypothetical protein
MMMIGFHPDDDLRAQEIVRIHFTTWAFSSSQLTRIIVQLSMIACVNGCSGVAITGSVMGPLLVILAFVCMSFLLRVSA